MDELKSGDGNDQSEVQQMKPKMLLILWAHYFYPIIILIAFLLGIFVSETTKEGPYQSASFEIDDNPPEYIIQLTDLHYHHLMPERTVHNTDMLRNISQHFKPSILTFTGDIVDASNSESIIYFRKQYEGNWKEVNKSLADSGIIEDNPDMTFISVSGNHDTMAVKSDSKSDFPFRTVFLDDNEEYAIQNDKIIKENYKTINIIRCNPIQLPMTSAPLGMCPRVTKDILDKIEDLYLEGATNIFITHFPFFALWSGESSKGNDISDILRKFDLMLTGHWHPQTPTISRDGNLLEIISSPLMRKTYFTMATIDNGMTSLHIVEASNTKQVVISYPVIMKQVTSNTVFNKNTFYVKGLFFCDDSTLPTLNLYVDDEEKGTFTTSIVKTGVYYIKCQVSDLSQGKHKLKVTGGDQPTEIEFFIGERIDAVSSQSNSGLFSPNTIIPLSVCLFVYAVLKIIPFWLIPGLNDYLDKYTNFLFGNQDNEESFRWYQNIYMGPLYFITKIRKSPLLLYIVGIVLTLYPFVLPLYLTPIDDICAAVFSWGLVVNGKVRFFVLNFIVWFCYELLLLNPALTLIAQRYEPHPYIVETVLLSIPILIGVIAWFVVCWFAGLYFTIFLSPTTYIVIAAIVIIIWKNIVDYRNAKQPNMKVCSLDNRED